MADSVDIVVVGGGCAGLVAALTASVNGAKVLLIEKSNTLGGTMAWSGGAIWAPMNDHQQLAGIHDTRAMAEHYMKVLSENRYPALIAAFLQSAPRLIRYLEEHTPLRFEVGTVPDYYAEAEGAIGSRLRDGFNESRSVGPLPLRLSLLGDHHKLLRRNPDGTLPLGFRELSRATQPGKAHSLFTTNDISDRIAEGWVGGGESLAVGLIAGVLESGVNIRLSSRVCGLVCEGNTVTGVDIDRGAEATSHPQRIRATQGVILCSGGFEWSALLRKRYRTQSVEYPASPPANEGDGHQMAISAGADMANLSDDWGWVAYRVPGEIVDNKDYVRDCLIQRAQPHSLIVNRAGERFANEAEPYTDLFRAMGREDADGKPLNVPAFHIFDQQFREQYSYGHIFPEHDTPEWIVCAATVGELADKLALPKIALQQTIAQFNKAASKNNDPAFGRGEHVYDLVYADRGSRVSPTLGLVSRAPFYAVELYPSTLGTKGGVVKSPRGEVLDAHGAAIPHLYAAGNVAASLSGDAYFGPGATIAEAMVFGYLAALDAVTNTVGI